MDKFLAASYPLGWDKSGCKKTLNDDGFFDLYLLCIDAQNNSVKNEYCTMSRIMLRQFSILSAFSSYEWLAVLQRLDVAVVKDFNPIGTSQLVTKTFRVPH